MGRRRRLRRPRVRALHPNRAAELSNFCDPQPRARLERRRVDAARDRAPRAGAHGHRLLGVVGGLARRSTCPWGPPTRGSSPRRARACAGPTSRPSAGVESPRLLLYALATWAIVVDILETFAHFAIATQTAPSGSTGYTIFWLLVWHQVGALACVGAAVDVGARDPREPVARLPLEAGVRVGRRARPLLALLGARLLVARRDPARRSRPSSSARASTSTRPPSRWRASCASSAGRAGEPARAASARAPSTSRPRRTTPTAAMAPMAARRGCTCHEHAVFFLIKCYTLVARATNHTLTRDLWLGRPRSC